MPDHAITQVDVITGLTWTIPCAPGITITAAQLKHRVPCWGYVAREADKPPSEIAKKVEEAGLASGEALELLRQGKKPSETISTPNGGSIMLRELLKPPTPGRKVVLLGDTCNSRAIAGMPFMVATRELSRRASVPQKQCADLRQCLQFSPRL